MKTKNNILILIGLLILFCCQTIADNAELEDIITITPTYTQAELDSMKIYFLKYGDEHTYCTYIFHSSAKKNEAIYNFYMANTHNSVNAQRNMYDMITEFYQSIGEELNSTANDIALSYLKRSMEQEIDNLKVCSLLLCGKGMPIDTIKAKEYFLITFKHRNLSREKLEKLWIANKKLYIKWYERDKKAREEIREERGKRLIYQKTLINSLIDTIATKTSYTQDELALLKDYFIQYGDPKAYTTYMNFCPDVENKAMYTFYMANTHNSAIAQYQMYCMIRDFYASIGKEMDPTASAIALSYLRRSVEQGNADAIQEMQKLGKRSPTSLGIPTKKCI